MGKTKNDAGDAVMNEAPRFVATVTAPGGPRRRAGFAFGPSPIHLTADDLNEENQKALAADPLLVIRPYAEPEPAATDQA